MMRYLVISSMLGTLAVVCRHGNHRNDHVIQTVVMETQFGVIL